MSRFERNLRGDMDRLENRLQEALQTTRRMEQTGGGGSDRDVHAMGILQATLVGDAATASVLLQSGPVGSEGPTGISVTASCYLLGVAHSIAADRPVELLRHYGQWRIIGAVIDPPPP